jgi:hypothetical protein
MPCQFELIVRQAAPCPVGPVIVGRLGFSDLRSGICFYRRPADSVSSGQEYHRGANLTIAFPAKFVSATLADLAALVSAKNSGRHHWIEDMADEKIEQL